jgi:hypothetical protein
MGHGPWKRNEKRKMKNEKWIGRLAFVFID